MLRSPVRRYIFCIPEFVLDDPPASAGDGLKRDLP